jgi:hypothetical protein
MLSAIERDVDKDIADFHPEDRNTFFSGSHRGQKPLSAGWFGDKPTHRNLMGMTAAALRLSL